MEENLDFKHFCEDKLNSFSKYLNSVNHYRTNLDLEKFSQEQIIFLDKHFELSLVLIISNIDNLIIIKNLHYSKLEWELKFFIKKIFLNIYESLKAIDSNNKLIINQLCIDELSKKEYFLLNKNIKMFKKNYGYDAEMKNVRNYIAGHIHNSDFDLYFSTLSNLNIRNSIKMGIDFMEINGDFSKFLLKNLKENIKI